MTTPVRSTARASLARRRAEIPPLRRLTRNVLIIGTVVAVLAAFGPVWVVRLGVLVAVAAAVIACNVAWRELAEARRTHQGQMMASTRAHGASLTAERQQHAAVLDTMTGRVRQTRAEIERLRATVITMTGSIAALRGQIAVLSNDKASALGTVGERDQQIAVLRETVRSREAELLALSEAAGQIRSIPRRVLAEHESAWEQIPDADDLWADGSHPTVASLVDVPMVLLPNYEGERKFA